MEITITELVLFTWAIIATGFAYKFRDEKHDIQFIFNKILEDDNVRNEMVTKFKQWKEARDGR